MKKVLFIVAVATLFFACQREINPATPSEPSKGFSFTAGIENLATRADINSSNELVWAQGDQIGVFVASWDNKNQSFTLDGNGGSTTGKFNYDEGEFTATDASFAFFPWGNGNNASDNGNVYFHLINEENYTSGKMVTPLVATLAYDSEAEDYPPIEFKHAGAAVKVTINNLPAGAHSICLAADQPVAGWFNVSMGAAGTSSIEPNSSDAVSNSVWLNFEPADSEREFTFLFPVPALTTPKFSFLMYDENNILVWNKNLKAQPVSIERGQVLEMPAISITPYTCLYTGEDWVLRGYLEHNDWTYDVYGVTDGESYIVKGVTVIGEGNQCAVKIKHPGNSWDGSWPSGNYVIPDGPGTYDIIFNPSKQTIKAIPSETSPYPSQSATLYFGINSTGGNGIAISSSTLAPGYSWPGMTISEREFINGKWYYKLEVDGSTVWGKTVSATIVGIGQWNTNSTALDFTTIKTEYYFEATSAQDIEQIDKRPEEVTVTFDGNMSDWALINGVTNGNHTVKVASDENYLYFYSHRAIDDNYSLIWNKGGYVYLGLDIDNDASTGDGSIYGNGPYEFVCYFYPYAGTADEPAFYDKASTFGSVSPVSYSIQNMEIKGVATTAGAEIEVRVPRSDIPTIPTTDSITIKLWGDQGLSKVTIPCML